MKDIEKLKGMLYSQNWEESLKAADQLAAIKSDESIAVLIQALKSDDNFIRNAASLGIREADDSIASKVNWLSYGKNPDFLNFSTAGVRRTALVVIDTFYGQVQLLENDKLIILNLATKLNSKYLWNEQNCFIKFSSSDVSHDLNNYCSEIRAEKWTDQ